MTAVTLALLLISQLANGADQPKVPTSYVVQISVRQKTGNDTGEILADPTIGVVAGDLAKFEKVDRIHRDGESVPAGTTVELKVDPVRRGEVKVTGTVEISSAYVPDREIIARESTSIHLSKTLTLGKNTQIRISKNNEVDRWIELRVVEAKDGLPPSVTRAGYDAPAKN